METKKIPLTAKILIALYDAFEIVGDIMFLGRPKTIREVLCPEYSKILYAVEKQRGRRKLQKVVDALIRRGYLRRSRKNRKAIILTSKGIKHVLELKFFKDHQLRRDKKWQMVSFDIPENLRKSRDRFREALKRLRFRRFQKSIWISPYDTYKEVRRIAKFYKIEEFVRYFLLEEKDLE